MTDLRLKTKAMKLALLLVPLSIGCSADSLAMGKKPWWASENASSAEEIAGSSGNTQNGGTDSGSGLGEETSAESAGSFAQGYQLGQTNGGNIVERIKRATVDREGCTASAMGRMEDALIKVAKTVRAPASEDSALVEGFFEGYLDAIREAIRDTRHGCDQGVHDDGVFAGQLYGNLICSMISVDLSIVNGVKVKSLYDGWSGGSADVIASCETEVGLTIEQCAGEDVIQSLALTINQSCSDITAI